MVMFLLCWELKLGCWLQSIIATLWKTLLENDGVYFDKSDFIFFDVPVNMASMLTSTIHCDFWTPSNFWGSPCIDVVRIYGTIHILQLQGG